MSEPEPIPTVFVDELQPGDVLLSMAQHAEISKVIAWCSDSEYSHAAIVADHDRLLEAHSPCSRYTSLADRVRNTAHYRGDEADYLYVRAYRLQDRGGKTFDARERESLLRAIASFEKKTYPLGDIVTLGLAVAARRKLIEDGMLRAFFFYLVGYLVPRAKGSMSCAEIVFRCLSETAVQPPRWLEPVIVVPEPKKGPHWDIDVRKLVEEFCKGISGDEEARQKFAWLCDDAGCGANAPPVSAAEYARQLEEFRHAWGLDPSGGGARVGPGQTDPNPNPRLVQPEDFVVSPSSTLLGEIRVRGD